ncbi:MAG: 23S rRNA (uracil(1939)-C(5))-methyltransferase RlmD, partial [Planctomycetota bacterium]
MTRSDLPSPVQRGDRVRLQIETLADGPDALAHIDGYVVLVPGTLPGEHVRAEITSAARKFGRARVAFVDVPAAERVEPACRHFLDCGGCHWQHIDYEAQLRFKQQRVQKDLDWALGEHAPKVLPTIANKAPYGQRHKVALQVLPDRRRGMVPAMHALRELDLVPLSECPASADKPLHLARATIAALADRNVEAWDPVTDRGNLRSVLVRTSMATGRSHLIVVARDDLPELDHVAPDLAAMGATTVSLNLNDGPESRLLGTRTVPITGNDRIEEVLDGVHYCISPTAFFQTSPYAAGLLVKTVLAALQPKATDIVADLYCGGGLFSLPLCNRAREVIGVEESPLGIADAEAGQRRNRIRNARFIRGSVEQTIERFGNDLPRPDLVVLDPPRDGCAPDVLERLSRLRPRQIAYVACDPKALARDLRFLHTLGYGAASVT